MPGALTPTEVIRAHASGAVAVKVFPAAVGGPSYLRALLGPLPHVPLVPTGGIAIEEVGAYLAAGAVCVGLGGALVGERAAGERRRSSTRSPSERQAAVAAVAERAVTGTPEVIAVGETMLSLVATDGPLDEATTFRATHGGAESNTCVALARSGQERRVGESSRQGSDGGPGPRGARG